MATRVQNLWTLVAPRAAGAVRTVAEVRPANFRRSLLVPMTFEGSAVAPAGARFAIAASRFNDLVVRRLVDGALDQLVRCGVERDEVDVAWCPGAFELPLVSRRLAESGRYAAVIALGCVIRGDTDHYEHVATGVTSGVLRAAMDTGVPVLFGVLTVDTIEQALERAGPGAGNKGAEVAAGAVEMAHLLARL